MMAEDPEPSGNNGRGAAISAFLKKKTGPLPNGAWVFIAAAVLFYMYKRNNPGGGKSAGGSASGGGATGEFTSSQSVTDPTTGAQSTYTATGPTSGFLQGGALTTAQASPMGYSGGDVYVNYPGQTTTPQQSPYPPQHAPAAGVGQAGSYWYTLPKDLGAGDLANEVYTLGVGPNPSQGTLSILAADLVAIMRANPQIDWTRVTTGAGKLPAGTALFVPVAGGVSGVAPKLPAHASLDAPLGYAPPSQQTVTQSPVSYVNN
jgi:hypothetical protein